MSLVKAWPISVEPIDRAVLFDQAAIGLVREQRLGDARHAERIDKAGDDRDGDDHDDGRTEVVSTLE